MREKGRINPLAHLAEIWGCTVFPNLAQSSNSFISLSLKSDSESETLRGEDLLFPRSSPLVRIPLIVTDDSG